MVTPLQVQQSLEARIEPLQEMAYDRSALGGHDDTLPNVANSYSVAYEGSRYEEDAASARMTEILTQTRTMIFASYVDVIDLQRDYRKALILLEAIVTAINGFRPDLPDVLSGFRVTDDAPIAVRSDRGTAYRYRARYEILTRHTSVPTLPPFDPVGVLRLRLGVFRSPVALLGEPPPVSTKDLEVLIDLE